MKTPQICCCSKKDVAPPTLKTPGGLVLTSEAYPSFRVCVWLHAACVLNTQFCTAAFGFSCFVLDPYSICMAGGPRLASSRQADEGGARGSVLLICRLVVCLITAASDAHNSCFSCVWVTVDRWCVISPRPDLTSRHQSMWNDLTVTSVFVYLLCVWVERKMLVWCKFTKSNMLIIFPVQGSYPVWDDFISKASKLQSQLR